MNLIKNLFQGRFGSREEPEPTINYTVVGHHTDNTIEQFKEVAERSVRSALMPDGHYGYVMPVGGVAAFRNEVSLPGVGVDIACGNCAIKTDITLSHLLAGDTVLHSPYLRDLATHIFHDISFGVGRKNTSDDAPVDLPLFEDDRWNLIPSRDGYRESLREKARNQLGTVGSGNHYVDVFADENGVIWVGVHFGSRGLGYAIASNFLAIGQGGEWGGRGKEEHTVLDLHTPAGEDYWHLMNLAGEYAYAGREWVANRVVSTLGARAVEMVHNHHNFAWKEEHFGEELVVVRKGATPAFPGQRGFVGGSMGDNAVILEGTENMPPEYLSSTVHGAGRVMSRTEAAGKRDRKTGQLKRNKETGEIIKPGRIASKDMTAWLEREGVILRGGGLDEAPQAYRRLSSVLDSLGNSIEVIHTLKPVIVCMADEGTVDPYKD